MIRLSLGRAALAGVLLAVLAQAAPAQPAAAAPQTQKINEFILKGYDTAGIKKPAARSTDEEFLRRAYIDLIGRIATPEEVIDFAADKSGDKRLKLVSRLMNATDYQPKSNGQPFAIGKDAKGNPTYLKVDYNADYAEHWANVWTVWLMTRTGHRTYREQMWTWLEYNITNNMSHKDMVTKLLTATGQVGGPKDATADAESGWKYKDEYAANFLVHHLGDPVKDDPMTPNVNERTAYGAFDAVPVTSRVTKLFLGLPTQCTQCHEHPFNKKWMQKDFWGVNAFFRQTVRSADPGPLNNQMRDVAKPVTLTNDTSLNVEALIPYERRNGEVIKSYPVMLKNYEQAQNGKDSAKSLDETFTKSSPGKSRRHQLAEWVIEHDNFAKAYVNRIWAHFFGRGLNKDSAADDFSSNDDINHPELLDYLAGEFVKYNYDPKKLMEWICASDVYSLSHVANPAYVDQKYDQFFARMPLKAMSPEVLFESLMTATKAERKGKAAKQRLRDTWMRKLVLQFGDDEGNELNFNGTIVQALLMMNGKELNGEIGVGRDASNVVSEIVKKHTNGGQTIAQGVYNDLFLMTLNRKPTAAELKALEEVRSGNASIILGAPAPAMPPKGAKGPNPPKSPPGVPTKIPFATDAVQFYQDVFWALLNTNEFMLNH